MASTHFINGTTILPAWCNDVNAATYSNCINIAAVRGLSKTVFTYAKTLGYAIPGDGGHGEYYLDLSDTTSADNGGTVLVASDGGRWKLKHNGEVSVKQFGMGNNVSNDIIAFQTMLQDHRDKKYTIIIPENTLMYLEFSESVPYLFIDGPVSIKGGNRFNCGFRVNHTRVDVSGHAPLFMWGVPSKGGNVNKVTGEVTGVGWFLTAGCTRFERMNHVYGANNLRVHGNYADFTAVTWPAADAGHPSGYQAGGWWSSNSQPVFAVGQTRDNAIWFEDNIGFASAEYQNAESIGFTNVYDLRYLNNYLVGWADDMAAHTCSLVWIENNHYEAVTGRLFVENSHNVKILHNMILPIVQPGSGTFKGSTRTYIHVDMQIRTGVGAVDQPANYDVLIEGNSIYLPSGSYCTGAVYCYGVQDGLTITDNLAHNDGAISPTTFIVASTVYNATWTGPSGNPDFSASGSVRMRSTKMDGNKCTGGGWLANEGQMAAVVYAGGAATDVIGPVTVNENEAGAYYFTHDAVDFRDTNRAITVSTDPYVNVHPNCIDRLGKVHSCALTTGQQLEGTHHAIGSPATCLDLYGLNFAAPEAGSVRGVLLTLTSGNHLDVSTYGSIKLLKNGSAFGVATLTTEIGNSPNTYKYLVSYFGTSMTFAKNDSVTIQLQFNASQATPIVGRADLLCLYN
jgi:hypothetical protein